MCTHMPISAYAQLLGVSADHLSKVCQTVMGMSALQLLHERMYLDWLHYEQLSVHGSVDAWNIPMRPAHRAAPASCT
jgi:hypothetical protein